MLRLRDIMTRDVLTLPPDATLRTAIATLASHHVSGAPVVAGRRVVGVVSMTDLLDFQASTPPVPSERTSQAYPDDEESEPRGWEAEDEPSGTFFTDLWADAGADVGERFDTVESSEWDLLGDHVVSELMDRHLHALDPDASIDAAADEMRRAGVHRVLVMEGDALLGIVTTMDITRAVADHRLQVRQYVFDRHGGDAGREATY